MSCTRSTFAKGTQVTCTATVSGYSPMGTVSWSKVMGKGGVTFSSKVCTLTSRTCSVTLTATSAGSIEIKAIYGGEPNNSMSSETLVI